MVLLESAGITDVGRKRKGNEDALLVDDELKLFIVADGMGGHQAGEVASKLVVETVRDYMMRFADGEEDIEELADSDQGLSKPGNRLLSGINLANWSINQLSKSRDCYRGMGSTISAVHFAEDSFIVANVGDSPVYLVHNNKIELLSVMHTVMAEQMALDPEGADRIESRFSHMLTRAMGVEETVRADVSEVQCFKEDVLVLSSDGLSNKVSPEEICSAVVAERPDKACRLLVDLANERGGEDNITAIVLRVKAVRRREKGVTGLVSRMLEKLFG